MRALALALCAVLCACDRRPARLAIEQSDTVTVNSRKPIRLAVRAFDANDRPTNARPARYEWLGGDRIGLSDDGTVTCSDATDSEAWVLVRGVSKKFIVQCRPIRGFRMPGRITLLMSDSAQDLPLTAVGFDGKPIERFRGSVHVRDTTIAIVRDGRIEPKAPGTTDIDIDAGDCTTSLSVDVIERTSDPSSLAEFREFVTPLRLVGGELQHWRIGPGRYEITLTPANEHQRSLILGTQSANCAPYHDAPQHYYCVVAESAVVAVRDSRPVGRGGKGLEGLSIRRWADAQTMARRQSDAFLIANDPKRRARTCITYMR